MSVPIIKHRRTLVMLSLTAVLVVGVAFLLSRRLNKTLYAERQDLLTMVTNSASQTFNRSIVSGWNEYDLSYSIMNRWIHETDNLTECINNVNAQHDFGNNYYFLVDEDGRYYCSDGVSGKLKDYENYSKTAPDRMEYLSTLPHMNPQKTYMIYRGRFDETVRMETENGVKYVVFYALAQDLTALNEDIEGMFESEADVMIYDEKGSILYSDFGKKQLIDGYNIYKKIEQCRMPFGESYEEILNKCKIKEGFVLDFMIGRDDYYLCSSPLHISDWSLALVLKAYEMDVVVGKGLWIIIMYIVIIVLLIVGALMYIAYRVKTRNQELRLEESQQLVAAIEETSKAKTVFLSNMSHDIRTPINGIMGVTTMARKAVNDPEKVNDYLDKIETASSHLLSLINDVLDMSRIESGKTKIETESVDINKLCENCAGIIKGQIADRNLTLNTEFDVEHSRAFVDEVHMRRILINILGNAVKFTRDGGRILFRCKETDCTTDTVTCRFEIKDTGIGMGRQFQEHIFEAFSQEANRERTIYKGTGLGMAITKQLVDLMNGKIEVESEVNKGSAFYVTLTFERDFEEHEEAVQEETEANIEGVKILLVEDNELNMEIAENLLESYGAKVDKAWDGLEAVDKFTARDIGTYDIILMDIMMPRMDGLEAARAIRAIDRQDATEIPIVAMTANAFDDDIRATQEAGMNAHLSKPIDIDKVVKTIAFFVKK